MAELSLEVSLFVENGIDVGKFLILLFSLMLYFDYHGETQMYRSRFYWNINNKLMLFHLLRLPNLIDFRHEFI